MKRISAILTLFATLVLLCYSCSEEEDSMTPKNNKTSLSFGLILNDLVTETNYRQQQKNPDCSEDVPAYVDIVLTGPTPVGTVEDPLRISINPKPTDYNEDGIDYITNEIIDLKLEPGSYSLEWFVVRNNDLEVMWMAPLTGESMASFVEKPLPLEFNLDSNDKKFVDVEVVCSEYEHLSFELETTKLTEFCFFASFCDPTGRQYPAAYKADIWLGTDSTGEILYSEEVNATGINEHGDAFAEPLCLALPDPSVFEDGEDYLYYEIQLLDWEGVYGDVEQTVLSGTLSRNDIEANFDGEDALDYYHLKFGCDPSPPLVGEEGHGGIIAYVEERQVIEYEEGEPVVVGSYYYVLVVPPNDLPPGDWETAIESSLNLELNGYNDWILPTAEQLINVMETVDAFNGQSYWSSDAIPLSDEALVVELTPLGYGSMPRNKDETASVRPVRVVFL